MNVWYLMSVPAWLVLVITAAARLHDLGPQDYQLHAHLRRLGLIGVGFIAGMQLAGPLTTDWWRYSSASWESFLVGWSWALVWLTTPGMPPWWDFILGVHRRTEEWRRYGIAARIRGELRALRDSFRPLRRRPSVT